VVYLKSTLDYHTNKTAIPVAPPISPLEEPFLDIGSVYETPSAKEIIGSPLKSIRGIREKNLADIEGKINERSNALTKYKEELEQAIQGNDKTSIRGLKQNILRNEQALEKYMSEYEQRLNISEGVIPSLQTPKRVGFAQEEERGLYGGAEADDDTISKIIKNGNDLILLLREADLALNSKLFPVARILNPIQKNTLREIYFELETELNSIPPLPSAKVESDLKRVLENFLNDLKAIL